MGYKMEYFSEFQVWWITKGREKGGKREGKGREGEGKGREREKGGGREGEGKGRGKGRGREREGFPQEKCCQWAGGMGLESTTTH